jgi:hypothetical protein
MHELPAFCPPCRRWTISVEQQLEHHKRVTLDRCCDFSKRGAGGARKLDDQFTVFWQSVGRAIDCIARRHRCARQKAATTPARGWISARRSASSIRTLPAPRWYALRVPILIRRQISWTGTPAKSAACVMSKSLRTAGQPAVFLSSSLSVTVSQPAT